LEQNEKFSTLETLIGRKYSLQKLNHLRQGNNVLDAKFITQMVFFGEIHVYLPLSGIGLFGPKRAYLPLEKPKLQEEFLSNTNSILTWKQCARCSCF
jgi:hypothetical protein